MKRFIMIGVLLFMPFIAAGCVPFRGEIEAGETNATAPTVTNIPDRELIVTPAIDFLEFSTLEDFLIAHRIVRTEGDIADVREHWAGELTVSEFEKLAEGTNFASLETLYLPVRIPEEFQIRRITLSAYGVTFRYLPRDVAVTDYTFWQAMSQGPSFAFGVSRRRDIENPMRAILEQNNAAERDLIDGKYLFVASNLFIWELDGVIFTLYMPLSPPDSMMDDNFGFAANNPLELVRFTKTHTINLFDTDAVSALIDDLIAKR